MIATNVAILAIAIFSTISVAVAEETQIENTARFQKCLHDAIRIADPVARRALIDSCNPNSCVVPCLPGTVCKNHQCVDKCYNKKCASGYRCILGECRKIMGCGQKCNYPKEVCALGVACVGGTCGSTVGYQEKCGGLSCKKCKSGFRCVSDKCAKVMKCGEMCDFPKWVCPIGARCSRPGRGVCIGNTIPEGKKCGGSSCDRCAAGTRCYGGYCRKEMGCNEKCDYPIWICKTGLSCKSGKCKGATVGTDQPCGGSTCNECKAHHQCVKGFCRREMGCGGQCDYPKWVCKSGLFCNAGICINGYAYGGGEKCSICKPCTIGYQCLHGACSVKKGGGPVLELAPSI